MELIVFGTKNIRHFTIFVQNKTLYVPNHTVNQIASLAIMSPNWYNSLHGTGCTLESNLVLLFYIHMPCHMQFCNRMTQDATSYLVQQDCPSPQEPVTHPCLANPIHMLIVHCLAIVEQCGRLDMHGTLRQHWLEPVFLT